MLLNVPPTNNGSDNIRVAEVHSDRRAAVGLCALFWGCRKMVVYSEATHRRIGRTYVDRNTLASESDQPPNF
jgi:hypothetical protein